MTNENTQLSEKEKVKQFELAISSYEENLRKLLAENGISVARFMQTTINTIKRTPKLLNCDRSSLFGSIFKAAELGLSLSDHSGECYVIPYKNQAQFQLAYKGFVELFYRSNVQSIWSSVVREKDEFSHELGTNPKLVHLPATKNRGEAVGAYACAKINGETIFVYMNKEEIEKIKEMSPASKSTDSPWNTKDPQKWMWQKTCIKQLAKTLPKSGALASAVQADNLGEMGGRIALTNNGELSIEDSFESQNPADISEKRDSVREKIKDNPNPEML